MLSRILGRTSHTAAAGDADAHTQQSSSMPPAPPLKARWRRIVATDAQGAQGEGQGGGNEPIPHPLPRASHSLCVVAGRAYIFGGEETPITPAAAEATVPRQPREPVDNAMHVVTLPAPFSSPSSLSISSISGGGGGSDGDDGDAAAAAAGGSGSDTQTVSHHYHAIPARPKTAGGPVPAPRLGHTAVVIGYKIYVYGGCGSSISDNSSADIQQQQQQHHHHHHHQHSSLLDEKGRVWVFDTKTAQWSALDPAPGTPVPPARAHHAAAANEHPRPDPRDHTLHPIVPDELAQPPDTPEGHGTLLVHGGWCHGNSSSGSSGGDDGSARLLADVWAFDVAARTWMRLPDAPGPARTGPSLAFVGNRLYRFGGFSGSGGRATKELGGRHQQQQQQQQQLDYFDMTVATFNDKGGVGELYLSAAGGEWCTLDSAADAPAAAAAPLGLGPGPRSGAGMQQVTTRQGHAYLLVFGGERAPGGESATPGNKFGIGVWSFRAPSQHVAAAAAAAKAKAGAGAGAGAGMKEEDEEDAARRGASWSRVGLIGDGSDNDAPPPCGWFASAAVDTDPATVIVWGGIDEENRRIGNGWALSVVD